MTNISTIFSVIGNNSSLAPIIVKDNIENTSKVTLAYKQGSKKSAKVGKYEARECFVEEFGTSAIWLTSVPVIKKLTDKLLVSKFFNLKNVKLFDFKNNNVTEIDSKLLSGKYYQTAERNLNLVKDNILKNDIQNIINKSKLFKNIKKSTVALGVGATIALLYKLTTFKQNLTEKKLNKHQKTLSNFKTNKQLLTSTTTFKAFINNNAKQTPSFTGLASAFAIDAGAGAGRIGTARSKGERKEYIFKTATFIASCYGLGPLIEKALNGIAKLLKLPINLDAKILGDKQFAKDFELASKSKESKDKFLSFVDNLPEEKIKKEKKIIDFIDDNIKNNSILDSNGGFKHFKNTTLELARKTGVIQIKDNARSPLKFIDTKAVEKINKNLIDLVSESIKNGNIKSFIKKIKYTKYGAIAANLAIGTTITAYILPKMQYLYREKIIGQCASPGLDNYNISFKGKNVESSQIDLYK